MKGGGAGKHEKSILERWVAWVGGGHVGDRWWVGVHGGHCLCFWLGAMCQRNGANDSLVDIVNGVIV